ncbi:MAG: iron chelate uptake ABC transporter family permease subunit, partial [Specibacter sp.]
MFQTPRPRSSNTVAWAVSLTLLLILGLVSLSTGSRAIALSDTWNAITAFDPSRSTHLLVIELRLPRTILAVTVGAALA